MFDIDAPPDPSRPANPWPRLLALGGVVLLALVLLGACLVAYVGSVPPREVEVELDALQPELPRFSPVLPFGSDQAGFTYGAYIATTSIDGRQEIYALLSRDPGSGCHVGWNATEEAGGVTGVFADRCSDARYDIAGRLIAGSAPRDLDRFPFDIEDQTVVVDIEEVVRGRCRDASPPGCSTDDAPESQELGSGPLD